MPDLPSSPAEASAPARRAVVVLGMHRSGTSLVAACLQKLGVDFGPRLMPPNADNPRGYFEHNDVVNLHDRLLLALDRSWDDVSPFPADWWRDDRLKPYREQLLTLLRRDFSAAPLWGLKDPRLCRLLPWWDSVWPELGVQPLFIIVRRAPDEIAASLARREGTSPAKAHLLTLRHILEAERRSRAHERIIVDFGAFVADEDAALVTIRRALGLPLSTAASVVRVVDPGLGKSGAPVETAAMPPWVEEADAALRLGLAGHEREMRFVLDRLARQLRAGEPFMTPAATSQNQDLLQQLDASRRQARWYEEEWRKAQTRVEKAQQRLSGKNPVVKPREELGLSKLDNQSKLINHNLSFVRNLGTILRNKLTEIFFSRR